MDNFERFLLGLVVGSFLILIGAIIILFLKGEEMEADIGLVPMYIIDSKGLPTVLWLPVSNTE